MPINMFDTRTMLAMVERMAPATTFLRDTLFKNVETTTSKKVDVDFKKGNRKLAPFVHPVKGGKVMGNEGFETTSFEPPLVSPDKVTNAADLLTRLPGENVYSTVSPEERAAERLAKDFIELDETITRREEWMCAQAIFTGKIPVVGDGLSKVIDFNFTNKETLSGTSLWSDPTSDPIAYLSSKHRTVQKTGYTNCDICIMASDVVDAFINHPKVKEILDVKNMDYAVIQPKKLPDGVTYIGSIKKLGLDIYEYNSWYIDDWTNPLSPQTLPLVPEGMIALLSSSARYSMIYGGVEVADEATNFIGVVEGTRVPSTWVEKRPARRVINISSRPLAVPHEVDSWFVAKVIA